MMLIEKRKEIVEKLNLAITKKNEYIDEQVKLYARNLEANYDNTEINELTKVLSAIDEVMLYELKQPQTTTVIKKVEEVVEELPAIQPEVKVEEVKVEETVITVTEPSTMQTETITEKTLEEKVVEAARPGMAYIGVPERS